MTHRPKARKSKKRAKSQILGAKIVPSFNSKTFLSASANDLMHSTFFWLESVSGLHLIKKQCEKSSFFFTVFFDFFSTEKDASFSLFFRPILKKDQQKSLIFSSMKILSSLSSVKLTHSSESFSLMKHSFFCLFF